MTVPVISALIKSHPNAKISVLTKVQFTPLFKHLPTVEVIGVDLKKQYKGLLGLFQLSQKIKALSSNLIAIPQYGKVHATESLNVATATAILLSEFARTTGR